MKEIRDVMKRSPRRPDFSANATISHISNSTPPNPSAEMRPFGQQLVRATYRARHINPSLFSARHLTGTRPAAYKSP